MDGGVRGNHAGIQSGEVDITGSEFVSRLAQRSCNRFPKLIKKDLAWNLPGSKANQVISPHLAVDENEVVMSKFFYESSKGRLGGIGNPAEHGFTEKCPADGDPVKSADQLLFLPGFY